MKDFLKAARMLLLDLASTLVFLVLFLLTHNTVLSVGLGIVFGLSQIGFQLIRRKPIETMEWPPAARRCSPMTRASCCSSRA
jgi:hypothetical protein